MSVLEPRRERQRLAWTRHSLADPAATLVRASFDAGLRSYWRSHGAGPSRIVMDSPPDREDIRPWLVIRDLLARGGVRVPQLLVQDVDAGFALLEDLGVDTYLTLLSDADAASVDRLIDAAIAQLLKLQAIPCPPELPHYDAAMLARELRLFDEWFLGRHLGLALDHDDLECLDRVHRCLIDAALAQPQIFVHRDFMPRNLMPADAGPAVIDFQGAVRGPIAYDPASLFRDAFLSWPEDSVCAWLDRYRTRAQAAGLPVPERARFRRDADWIGVQRHLKILGLFTRLHYRDGKPKYLADAPRFLGYLDAVLPRYPELAPLAMLIEAKVKPAMSMSVNA